MIAGTQAFALSGSGPHDSSKADSTPDYDDWGWDDYWKPEDWMAWHGAMKAAYGKNKADYKWATAWQEQGWFEGGINARTFNSDFRNWAKSEGLTDALYWGKIGPLVKVLGEGADVVKGDDDTPGYTKPPNTPGSKGPDPKTGGTKNKKGEKSSLTGLYVGVALGLMGYLYFAGNKT
jgi:hypothetical protein